MNRPSTSCEGSFSEEDIYRLASKLVALKTSRTASPCQQQRSNAEDALAFSDSSPEQHFLHQEDPNGILRAPQFVHKGLISVLNDGSDMVDQISGSAPESLYPYGCSSGSTDYPLGSTHLEDRTVSSENFSDRFNTMSLASSSSNYSALEDEELIPFDMTGNQTQHRINNNSSHFSTTFDIDNEHLKLSSLDSYHNATFLSDISFNELHENQVSMKTKLYKHPSCPNSSMEHYQPRENRDGSTLPTGLTQNDMGARSYSETISSRNQNRFCIGKDLKINTNLHDECIKSQSNLEHYDILTKYHCVYCYRRVYALASMIANGNGISKMEKQTMFSTPNNENESASLSGPGISEAVRGRTSTFQIVLKDGAFAHSSNFADALKVTIVDPSGYPCSSKVKQLSSGKFSVRYKPDFVGVYTASVSVNGKSVDASPYRIQVGTHHKYQFSGEVKGTIGESSNASYSLNQPWGICCNSEGYVFIGDRGNNVIRVFKPNMTYSHSIGKEGSELGELRKPAGVTINSQGQIVVADKDNHRIQVFDFQGKVTLAFGERGSDDWQLEHPWDVTIAPQDLILVSDCRNGRISMFTSEGCFIRSFGASNALLKWPRGIYFRESDKKIITTDMMRNQIVVINAFTDSSQSDDFLASRDHPSLMGKKGSDPGELHRPQGVTCDQEGNIIVSDSKNSRVQVFDADGNYLHHWSVGSQEPIQPSQPMGVAVSPAGDVLVVDAANNKVFIY